MRDLNLAELDAGLAEQLPARELMARSCHWSWYSGGGDGVNFQSGNSQSGNDAYGGVVTVGGGNYVAVLVCGNANGGSMP